MPGPQSAGIVQGRDVRELREPGLLGAYLYAGPGHLSGAIEGSQEYKENGDNSHLPSYVSTGHPEFDAKESSVRRSIPKRKPRNISNISPQKLKFNERSGIYEGK
ncbi:hypothetical protein ABFV05_014028 [Capra hircus]